MPLNSFLHHYDALNVDYDNSVVEREDEYEYGTATTDIRFFIRNVGTDGKKEEES